MTTEKKNTEETTEEKPLSKWQRDLKEKFNNAFVQNEKTDEILSKQIAKKLLGEGLTSEN